MRSKVALQALRCSSLRARSASRPARAVPLRASAPRQAVPAPSRTACAATRAAAFSRAPPFGILFRCGCHGRCEVCRQSSRCSWVTDGAVVVRAHREGADTSAVDDDGGFGCLARRHPPASGLSVCPISRMCPRCTAPGPCSVALRHPLSIWALILSW